MFWENLKSYVSMRKEKASNGIYNCKDFRMILERERMRTDRNGQSFSLVVFGAENAKTNGSYSKHLINALHYRRLRATDEIGWFDKQKIGVLLHNTGQEGAWSFVYYIRDLFPAKYQSLDCKVYMYPLDDLERVQFTSNKRMRERFNIRAKMSYVYKQ